MDQFATVGNRSVTINCGVRKSARHPRKVRVTGPVNMQTATAVANQRMTGVMRGEMDNRLQPSPPIAETAMYQTAVSGFTDAA